jgi:hypothetical protein
MHACMYIVDVFCIRNGRLDSPASDEVAQGLVREVKVKKTKICRRTSDSIQRVSGSA